MKTKKIPMRTCVVTHEKLAKKDLIRVVRTPEGSIVIDETGKQNGRGAYIKKDLEVLDIAKKKNILGQVLKVEIPDDIFIKLRSIIENK